MYANPVVPVPKDVPPITASGPDTATGVHPVPLLTGTFTLAASFGPAVVLVELRAVFPARSGLGGC